MISSLAAGSGLGKLIALIPTQRQSKPPFGKDHIGQAQVHTGQGLVLSSWSCPPITPRNPRHNRDRSNAKPTRKTTCFHCRVAHKLQQFVNRTFPKPPILNFHYQFLTNNGFGSTCSPSFTASRFVRRCETLEATREDIAFTALSGSSPRAVCRLLSAPTLAFPLPDLGRSSRPAAPASAGVNHLQTTSRAVGRVGSRRTRVVFPLSGKLRLPTSAMTQ